MNCIKKGKQLSEKLYATHEGKLNLNNSVLDVAILNNGQRILTQSAVFKALDRPSRGNSRVIGIPTFMDAKNLQPLISEDLRGVINKIEYKGLNDTIQIGFDANILPLVSDLYLKARELGVIKTSAQLATAQHRLGHSDLQTTMNIYTHITQKAIDDIGEKFSKYVDF